MKKKVFLIVLGIFVLSGTLWGVNRQFGLAGLMQKVNVVRGVFSLFRRDFGRKKETSEDKHIGFRTSADEESEEQHHSVAAETSASVK